MFAVVPSDASVLMISTVSDLGDERQLTHHAVVSQVPTLISLPILFTLQSLMILEVE